MLSRLRILFLTPLLLVPFAFVSYAQLAPAASDPDHIGPYAIGHTSYTWTDVQANNRPVFVSLWYPVNPDNVNSSPTAEYLTDPYTGEKNIPATFSKDWEALGYDHAMEQPLASRAGPFPLLIISPGRGVDYWNYLFIGTRLASHGYVVGVIEHWTDCQWSWGPCEGPIANAKYRTRDISFAITQLLALSKARSNLLYRVIDQHRIAVGGHSLGGYAAYALAGGDRLVCDALWPAAMGIDTLPYPEETCVAVTEDPRIKALISLDGASWFLRYHELSNVGIPTLLLAEGVDKFAAEWGPDLRDTNARAHAAIGRDDSYRVDIAGTNHMSFTNQCDAMQVWFNRGLISSTDLDAINSSWPCANWTVTISSTDEHAVITKYMIAFLDSYLRSPDRIDRWILTPEYALGHSPIVDFFDNEHCKATLPDHTYLKYRPYQRSDECEVAPKDPGWLFAAQQ